MAQKTDFSFSVTAEAYILGALMLILIPFPWFLAWFCAAAAHELFHCLALRLSGKQIHAIRIGVTGAQIHTGALSNAQTLTCSLAGPAGGILLLLLARMFPRLAVCAFLQSAFNLMPIYPLDGGRAFRSLAELLFSQRTADKLCLAAECVILTAMLLLGAIAAFVWHMGAIPVVLSGFLAARMMKIKIPCKWRFHGVQ